MAADETPPNPGSAGSTGPEPAAGVDPAAVLRSRQFVVILVVAALVGLIVSLVSWGFLELVEKAQNGVYKDLPEALGFTTTPDWWPIPVLLVAGVIVAFAITKLPGRGGHVPANGLHMGGTEVNMLPGIALAAFATLALGVVLGPEAPLVAIGAGVAMFTVQLAKRDAPPQLLMIMGAAGSFAAISVIFGSPIVAAVLVIEVSGLGGSMLPLILIPGLVAAGIGSLVFVGMAGWTGLSTSAYALVPLKFPRFTDITPALIVWTIVLGIVGALLTFVIAKLGRHGANLVLNREWVLVPLAGVLVAIIAIVFNAITDKGFNEVLFSGQAALPGLVDNASEWSLGALLLLLLFKGLAWSVSLSSFRGGPTFPAILMGAVGGIAASHLPGLSLTPAVAVGMGVMVVSFLKLPLSAIIIASVLCASAGLDVGPLIILGVVVAYLTTLGLEGRLGPPAGVLPDDAGPSPAATPGPAPAPAG